MIKPYQLPAKAVEMITARIKDEQNAFYFYLSASAWCRLNGYNNAAGYFEVEMRGEQHHYQRLMEFLSNWNSPVDFKPIEEPVKTFKSLLDILEQAYNMEVKLLEKYEEDAKTIFPISQTAFIQVHNFVHIQNDSVCSADQYLKKAYGYCETDPTLMLFQQEVFESYSQLAY